MTDARWSDVQDEIERAAKHYGLAVRLFDATDFDSESAALDELERYRNEMALQHAMQAAHTTLRQASSASSKSWARKRRQAQTFMPL